MNHCRKCDSDYEKPGSCNCFAAAKVAVTIESADYWRGYADGQRQARGWSYTPTPHWTTPYWTTTVAPNVNPTTTTVTWTADNQPQTTGFSQVIDGTQHTFTQ